jgi:hypothetical protein
MRIQYLDWDKSSRRWMAVTTQGSRLPLRAKSELEAYQECELLEADEREELFDDA